MSVSSACGDKRCSQLRSQKNGSIHIEPGTHVESVRDCAHEQPRRDEHHYRGGDMHSEQPLAQPMRRRGGGGAGTHEVRYQ
jgi:hypothetical protein